MNLKTLSMIAVLLGSGQIVMNANDIFISDEWKHYKFSYVLLGLGASLSWTLYHFNANGLNYPVAYYSFGIFMYLYVLHKLLTNLPNKEPTSDRSNH